MSVATLEAEKAKISAEKDKAVAAAKAKTAKINAQLREARAAAKLEEALQGLTGDERAAALKAVTS